MKDLEKTNIRFFNLIAGYYDFFFGNWIRTTQKKAINIIKIRNNSKILDAGCGTGNFLKILESSKKNLNLYGIDISKEMLKIAKGKLKKSKLEIKSVEKIDFKDNSFDYVFSIDAFHHYSNQNLSIKKFNKILKENGCLAVIDLSFGLFLNKIFQKIEPGNNKMHSPEEMRHLFKMNKFRDVKQNKVGLFTTLTYGTK
ncbi:MAG: class I SAM-dependent methyltransferase [Nanoarchaeota archaeon]